MKEEQAYFEAVEESPVMEEEEATEEEGAPMENESAVMDEQDDDAAEPPAPEASLLWTMKRLSSLLSWKMSLLLSWMSLLLWRILKRLSSPRPTLLCCCQKKSQSMTLALILKQL